MGVTREQRRQVTERAGHRCEYCHMHADLDDAPFQVDHVRPQKHHGATVLENLGWACFPCNNHKACNAAGYDPETNQIEPLFNPRQHKWDDHFEWDGPRLRGKTAIGRATIEEKGDRYIFHFHSVFWYLFPLTPSPAPHGSIALTIKREHRTLIIAILIPA